jgi:hypothetical protein
MARDAFLRSVAERRNILVPSLVADKRAVDIDVHVAALAATGEGALTREEIETHHLHAEPDRDGSDDDRELVGTGESR